MDNQTSTEKYYAESIKRRDAIAEMDHEESRSHKTKYFSIQFYKFNGELVQLIRAKKTGLRANMNKERLRGVQAVDSNGNNMGHIYPVCIDNIRVFNGKKVYI
jgi:hypothetical protein